MRRSAFVLAAACSLAIAGCSRAEDAPSSKVAAAAVPVDKEFGDKVRAYLLQHPEVIKEAIDQYNDNQEVAAANDAKLAIVKHRADIERDPRDFVVNPKGTVTVTQFYDYRCPYCIAVAPAVLQLMKKDTDVRFVFKELAILGPTSERAAHGVLAIKRAGGDYLKAHEALFAAKPLDDAAINRVLAAENLPPSAADTVNAADAKQMLDVRQLAGLIGVTGTPAFVVGDTLIPGADAEALQRAIDAQKKKG